MSHSGAEQPDWTDPRQVDLRADSGYWTYLDAQFEAGRRAVDVTDSTGQTYHSILGHREATNALRDDEQFRSGGGGGVGQPGAAWQARFLIGQDGDEHRQHRRELREAIASRQNDVLPQVATIVRRSLPVSGTTIDVCAAADTVAAELLLALLGLGVDARSWLDESIELLEAWIQGERPIRRTLAVVVARLRSLCEVIDEPARAADFDFAIDADRLAQIAPGASAQDRSWSAAQIVLATTDTVSSFVVTTILQAAHDDALLHVGGADGAAADELLRLRGPVTSLGRRSCPRDDTDGGPVVVWAAAANADPAVFEDPRAFRPDRAPVGHLALGAGPHHCLGASIAKSVAVALLDLLGDVTEVEIVDVGPPVSNAVTYRPSRAQVRLIG